MAGTDYETYKGFPVGEEIVPKNGWQLAMHEKGHKFFEPIPQLGPSPHRSETVVTAPPETVVKSGGRLAAEQAVQYIETAAAGPLVA